MSPGTTTTLLLSWVVLPVLLLTVTAGAGLLVDAVSGRRLPGPLVPAVGLAMLVALTTLTTTFAWSAPWTGPACAVAAIVGLALGTPRLRGLAARSEPGALACTAVVAGVVLAYGAPVLATGRPTFAGWISLDDGATWLAMADRLVTAGRNTTGLAPSTFETTLAVNWEQSSYPIGAFPLLGLGQQVLGVDGIHLLQPHLATLAAILGLGVVSLLRTVGTSWAWAALGGALAAQPALLYAYALWSGVKELALAPIVLAAAMLAARPAHPGSFGSRFRSLVPFTAVAAGAIGIGGVLAAAWLVVPAAVLAVRTARRIGPAATAASAAAAGALLLAAVLPTQGDTRLADLGDFAALATTDDDIGNLRGPLPIAQLSGIWPATDFRDPLDSPLLAGLLIAATLLLAVAGLVRSARDRRWALPVYAASTLPLGVALGLGGPWIAAKAMAIASPATVACALVGAWSLARAPSPEPDASRGAHGPDPVRRGARGPDPVRRGVALASASAVALGVLWSNALAYRGAWLAPTDELAELATIAEHPGLTGPTLMVDYSPYGARHLLRALDAQGAGELRRWEIPTRSGSGLAPGEYADIDDFPATSLAPFTTLVLRRSPLASRPAAEFALAWSGRFYEAWSRSPGARTVTQVPLGDHASAVAAPDCAALTSLADTAAPGERLALVERRPALRARLDDTLLPARWQVDASGAIRPGDAPGRAVYRLDVVDAGEFVGWLPGSSRGRVTLAVDGVTILDERHRLAWAGHGTPTETIHLAPGEHLLTLGYSGADWHAGSSGPQSILAPPVFATSTADSPVTTADPARADALCGRQLDWVAVVGAG